MSDCILCGNTETTVIIGAQPGRYHHCRVCDFIFLEPGMRLGREEEKSRYMTHDNTLESAGYVQMFETFLAGFVLPFAQPPCTVLDYGCGPGPVLQVLLQRRGFITDIYDPYFAPELPARTYDVITSTEALEHVYNPLQVWQLLDRLLRPGGILALMTHFHSGPEMFAGWWYHRDPTHVVFFSENTFSWLAHAFGYTILATDHKKSLALQKRDTGTVLLGHGDGSFCPT